MGTKELYALPESHHKATATSFDLLKLLKTSDFNIHLFYILADEINNVAGYDLTLHFMFTRPFTII